MSVDLLRIEGGKRAFEAVCDPALAGQIIIKAAVDAVAAASQRDEHTWPSVDRLHKTGIVARDIRRVSVESIVEQGFQPGDQALIEEINGWLDNAEGINE